MNAVRHALVTGAAGDIGSAIVRRFLRDDDARVTAVDIKTAQEIHSRYPDELLDRIEAATLDLTDAAAVSSLFDSIAPVDVVVGNAGVVTSAPFVDVALGDWQRTLDVNLTANFLLGQEAARHFLARGATGTIVYTGSWVGSVPWPEIAPYTVSKAALEMLAKQMARELARDGIRVNVVAPGIVDAGLAGMQLRTDPTYAARAARVVPLGYFQTPEQVAEVVAFLCSPGGDYITGTVLLADGGCSLFQFDSDLSGDR